MSDRLFLPIFLVLCTAAALCIIFVGSNAVQADEACEAAGGVPVSHVCFERSAIKYIEASK